MENVVCRRVPTFALFRESGKKFAAPGEMYEAKVFSHGLHYADIGAAPVIKDVFETAALNDDARAGEVRPRAAAAGRTPG